MAHSLTARQASQQTFPESRGENAACEAEAARSDPAHRDACHERRLALSCRPKFLLQDGDLHCRTLGLGGTSSLESGESGLPIEARSTLRDACGKESSGGTAAVRAVRSSGADLRVSTCISSSDTQSAFCATDPPV